MSIILITSHDENINKIVDETQLKHEIKAKKTNRSDTCRPFKKPPTKPHATMGIPEENPPDPCEYLKKRTGHPAYTPNPEKVEKLRAGRKEQGFRTKSEIELYDQRIRQMIECPKNFISKNIQTVLGQKRKDPVQRTVIERHGTTKRMSDGLEPVYIKRDVFGKTPKYLKQFIKEREMRLLKERDCTGVEKAACRYIKKDEREELMKGLKHNWEELQKQYQGLPILTDTIPKINRKSKLEAELKQLEKDIVLLERHPYIYVYETGGQF